MPKYKVGMFFEKFEYIQTVDEAHARKEGDKWAEGIADTCELHITEVVVIEDEDGNKLP